MVNLPIAFINFPVLPTIRIFLYLGQGWAAFFSEGHIIFFTGQRAANISRSKFITENLFKSNEYCRSFKSKIAGVEKKI